MARPKKDPVIPNEHDLTAGWAVALMPLLFSAALLGLADETWGLVGGIALLVGGLGLSVPAVLSARVASSPIRPWLAAIGLVAAAAAVLLLIRVL